MLDEAPTWLVSDLMISRLRKLVRFYCHNIASTAAVTLMDERQQDAYRDEQDAENPVEHRLAMGIVGEALERLRCGRKEEPHDQDVNEYHRRPEYGVLGKQRVGRPDELRHEGQKEHDGLGIQQIDPEPP